MRQEKYQEAIESLRKQLNTIPALMALASARQCVLLLETIRRSTARNKAIELKPMTYFICVTGWCCEQQGVTGSDQVL